MTALDLMALGVEFRRDRRTEAGIAVFGPEGQGELMGLVQNEVAIRSALMDFAADAPPVRFRERAGCDVCGDALLIGRGGMCHLCTVAWSRREQ